MARRVKESWRKLKNKRPDLLESLTNTSNITSNRLYNRFKKKGIKPNINRKELQRLINKASNKNKIPIKVSRDMAGRPFSDGVSINYKKGAKVRIHPIAQYYDKGYVKDLIGHEVDHAKIYNRSIKNKGKTLYR